MRVLTEARARVCVCTRVCVCARAPFHVHVCSYSLAIVSSPLTRFFCLPRKKICSGLCLCAAHGGPNEFFRSLTARTGQLQSLSLPRPSAKSDPPGDSQDIFYKLPPPPPPPDTHPLLLPPLLHLQLQTPTAFCSVFQRPVSL